MRQDTGKIVLKSPEINLYELLNQAVKFDRLYCVRFKESFAEMLEFGTGLNGFNEKTF